MQLKAILKRIHKHRSFVYGADRLYERCGQLSIDVDIRPRANGRPKSSATGRRRPGYDTLSPRRFEFIPILGIAVYIVYAMHRVDCPTEMTAAATIRCPGLTRRTANCIMIHSMYRHLNRIHLTGRIIG